MIRNKRRIWYLSLITWQDDNPSKPDDLMLYHLLSDNKLPCSVTITKRPINHSKKINLANVLTPLIYDAFSAFKILLFDSLYDYTIATLLSKLNTDLIIREKQMN